MVKNLVTGVAGFVASHLADYVLERGEQLVGTYRWTEDMRRVEHVLDRITLAPVDLLDLSATLRVLDEHRPDYIFHLAAQSYVTDSFSNPAITIQVNTIGTLYLLEAVRILKQKEGYDPVIHVCSSSEVYGQVKPDEVPIKETNAFRPANPYAVGKVGEDMIAYQYFQSYGIRAIRTRMFTHTGPRRTMMSAECNFARQIALIEKGKQPPVLRVGNLDSVRTFADVRDAVRAYYTLVRRCTPGEAYNIGGNRTMRIGDMLDMLISLSPKRDEIKVEVDPALLRPSDVTLQIPDCSKFIDETGWEPEIAFEQTLRELLDWWRSIT
ncbi:MAG: SDR family oxidoreductase [Proteobacteria bacterium]|nr:SDR family oxidoreductase [Pseudomonadota bacterium]